MLFMIKYRPPCLEGECPSRKLLTTEFCTVLGERILGAGGAGLLEIQRCPYDALMTLVDTIGDPDTKDVRRRIDLGIKPTGCFSGG